MDPDQGAINPGFVAGGILDVNPVVLDFQDFHRKVFVHRGPFYFRGFGAGFFSKVSLVIFDNGTFIFLGGEGPMNPVFITVQILDKLPVVFCSEQFEWHILEYLPDFFMVGTGSFS